jgi:hypothetical protein
VAVAAGLIGLVEGIDNNLKVPVWIWLTIFALGLVYAQFQAFHDVRIERDSLAEDRAGELARVSKLFGTELRGIRRNIEMAKAMRPPLTTARTSGCQERDGTSTRRRSRSRNSTTWSNAPTMPLTESTMPWASGGPALRPPVKRSA